MANLFVLTLATIASLLLGFPISTALSVNLTDGRGVDLKSVPGGVWQAIWALPFRIYLLVVGSLLAVAALVYFLVTPTPQLPAPGIRSSYHIVMSNCAIDPIARDDLKLGLIKLGFRERNIRINQTNRPVEGTAGSNTVYFYYSLNEQYAHALARELSRQTRRKYQAARGDGLGFNTSEFPLLFAVHTIDQSCER